MVSFFALLEGAATFYAPATASGPHPMEPLAGQIQASAIGNRGKDRDIRVEAAHARLRITSLGQTLYSFEISDLRDVEAPIAVGVLRYSDSEVSFTLQEHSGWRMTLKARKLDQRNSLIQCATQRSSVNLIFSDEQLGALLERARTLDAEASVEERITLVSQILHTTRSFEPYWEFVSREALRSRGLASLAYLLAEGEVRGQSGVVNLLTSISRFLTPSVHFAAMAKIGDARTVTEIRAVKASYATQTDAACVAACVGVGGVGSYLCDNAPVGSLEWWVCLVGTWALTTYCIYACTM